MTISDGSQDWYGLGPVFVLPNYQRQGIGRMLIQEGLSLLKDLNVQGCCLVGYPDYYKRFGFRNISGLILEGVPLEVFLGLYPSVKILSRESLCFMTDSKPMAGCQRLISRAFSHIPCLFI